MHCDGLVVLSHNALREGLAYSITTVLLTLYKELTMNADKWIFLLALCFICVSSNEEPYLDNACEQNLDGCNEMHTLSASLGSSVLLPCNFTTRNLNWVSWAHTNRVDVVHLTSDGRIKFMDHRYGRVKAFPNQGSEGNYSIGIDDLQNSDLGCYCCKQGHVCLQVELVAESNPEEGAPIDLMWLLIYICVGVAAFILLSMAGYCCMKCICEYSPSLALSKEKCVVCYFISWIDGLVGYLKKLFISVCCNNRLQYNVNNPEETGGASAPPEEAGRAPVDQQQRGAGNDDLVYENDDQDPRSNQQDDATRNYCNPLDEVQPDPDPTQPTQSSSGIYPNLHQFERTESRRTKQSFHIELFSRLRQASLSRHYYVNQGELRKQQAASTQTDNPRRGLGKKMKKKKVKENGEYKNPIYNRSTDHLNRL
ncbi:uncharacterized protein LOC119491932 isoform X3 [Sebastes umbrosus]|uniref:uncharacterized protein LOC119491932 isoform X3 n=1 Tax=Sebastes umbrosus TaxID=72105 RepID=UPI0018A0C699|nr:uncharacterized protein LOC119491932 isoform X3 [Sebastes umbrosus]